MRRAPVAPLRRGRFVHPLLDQGREPPQEPSTIARRYITPLGKRGLGTRDGGVGFLDTGRRNLGKDLLSSRLDYLQLGHGSSKGLAVTPLSSRIVEDTNSRPVIGICAVRENAKWSFWDQLAHLVADAYVASVQRTGAVAVLLPVDARHPLELLDRSDGLLVIGGADIDPAVYGQERDPQTESTYPDRDAFELALLNE